MKKNPWGGEELFDKATGGYVVKHANHLTKPHEMKAAQAFMKKGNKVKLLDESGAAKTPDAEIDGVIYEFKNIDKKARSVVTNIRNKLEDAVKQADNVVIRTADGPFKLTDIRDAITKHVNSGKPYPSVIKVLDKDDLTILIYPF